MAAPGDTQTHTRRASYGKPNGQFFLEEIIEALSCGLEPGHPIGRSGSKAVISRSSENIRSRELADVARKGSGLRFIAKTDVWQINVGGDFARLWHT